LFAGCFSWDAQVTYSPNQALGLSVKRDAKWLKFPMRERLSRLLGWLIKNLIGEPTFSLVLASGSKMSASGKNQPEKGNGLVTVLESETFLFVTDIK
jgi:hypothetical protein